MTLTRAQVELILISRCGPVMKAAGMDVNANPSPNADLNDPIGYALRRLGYSVADVSAVANTDVDDVSTDDYDALFDLAELRTLQNVIGNYALVDSRVGQLSESYSQLRDGLEKRIEKLKDQIESDYGIGGSSLQGGTIELDFVDHNEDLA